MFNCFSMTTRKEEIDDFHSLAGNNHGGVHENGITEMITVILMGDGQ